MWNHKLKGIDFSFDITTIQAAKLMREILLFYRLACVCLKARIRCHVGPQTLNFPSSFNLTLIQFESDEKKTASTGAAKNRAAVSFFAWFFFIFHNICIVNTKKTIWDSCMHSRAHFPNCRSTMKYENAVLFRWKQKSATHTRNSYFSKAFIVCLTSLAIAVVRK